MNKFDNVYISHIFQEGKKVANWNANQAVYMETRLSQQDDLIKEVELMETINYDMIHANEGKINTRSRNLLREVMGLWQIF